jgi:hypothetical protein
MNEYFLQLFLRTIRMSCLVFRFLCEVVCIRLCCAGLSIRLCCAGLFIRLCCAGLSIRLYVCVVQGLYHQPAVCDHVVGNSFLPAGELPWGAQGHWVCTDHDEGIFAQTMMNVSDAVFDTRVALTPFCCNPPTTSSSILSLQLHVLLLLIWIACETGQKQGNKLRVTQTNF